MATVSGLDIIQKYNWQVPRYTSYPPAPYFTQAPGEARTTDMILRSNRVGPRHASIYFHVPFCPKRCLFCGCHTEIGRPGAFIRNYMETMERELDLLIPMLDRNRSVTQVHFGGGTPNAVPFAYLEGLIGKLKSSLTVDADAEIAIECDPNLLNLEKVLELGAMGFNRLSIGIQDFDPKVLEAVNRRFPKTAPKDIFRVAREWGFKGNNLDLIYGLPYQTTESFRIAIAKAIDSGPDRISLFPYAHVPWVKGHQGRLQDLPMAGIQERLEIAWESRESLMHAGFVPIGMDHFALPDDELAIAARTHGLHRNFQGYCTSARAGQVYALGASAISQLHEGYIQNAKDLDRYLSAVNEGRLSHETAYRMRPQDMAVRNIINGLLCDGEARIEASLDAEGLDADWKREYLEASKANLTPLLADGLAILDGDFIRLTGNGHYASRAVASAFDPMLKPKAEQDRPRYSQAL
ncbi:MAG: oxygen-independent coproporphyrinogen oxidase [Fibrobacteres bacterium]|nr:oxygen-independent coproporphyrinogen oxidase [Fibrobacterota bacterium]